MQSGCSVCTQHEAREECEGSVNVPCSSHCKSCCVSQDLDDIEFSFENIKLPGNCISEFDIGSPSRGEALWFCVPIVEIILNSLSAADLTNGLDLGDKPFKDALLKLKDKHTWLKWLILTPDTKRVPAETSNCVIQAPQTPAPMCYGLGILMRPYSRNHCKEHQYNHQSMGSNSGTAQRVTCG